MPRGRSEEGVQLGRRLFALRDAADLTQQAAAQQLGVGERTYQAWEAGQRTPRYHNRVKLAALYGGAPADYLPGDDVRGENGRLAELEARILALEAALGELVTDDADAGLPPLPAALARRLEAVRRSLEDHARQRNRRAGDPPAEAGE